MTNPTRKRVVTLDDLNVLNQNAAYARQKGEEASAAAQQADTARQNLEALGGDTQAAGQQATQAAQAATLAKNSATAAALQASQAAGDAVTAAELAEGAAGTANQAAGAATTAAQRVTDAVLDLTDIKVDIAQGQALATAAVNTLSKSSGTGILRADKTALDAAFAAAPVGAAGTDAATGDVYLKTQGAADWGEPITNTRQPLLNIRMFGVRPGVSGATNNARMATAIAAAAALNTGLYAPNGVYDFVTGWDTNVSIVGEAATYTVFRVAAGNSSGHLLTVQPPTGSFLRASKRAMPDTINGATYTRAALTDQGAGLAHVTCETPAHAARFAPGDYVQVAAGKNHQDSGDALWRAQVNCRVESVDAATGIIRLNEVLWQSLSSDGFAPGSPQYNPPAYAAGTAYAAGAVVYSVGPTYQTTGLFRRVAAGTSPAGSTSINDDTVGVWERLTNSLNYGNHQYSYPTVLGNKPAQDIDLRNSVYLDSRPMIQKLDRAPVGLRIGNFTFDYTGAAGVVGAVANCAYDVEFHDIPLRGNVFIAVAGAEGSNRVTFTRVRQEGRAAQGNVGFRYASLYNASMTLREFFSSGSGTNATGQALPLIFVESFSRLRIEDAQMIRPAPLAYAPCISAVAGSDVEVLRSEIRGFGNPFYYGDISSALSLEHHEGRYTVRGSRVDWSAKYMGKWPRRSSFASLLGNEYRLFDTGAGQPATLEFAPDALTEIEIAWTPSASQTNINVFQRNASGQAQPLVGSVPLVVLGLSAVWEGAPAGASLTLNPQAGGPGFANARNILGTIGVNPRAKPVLSSATPAVYVPVMEAGVSHLLYPPELFWINYESNASATGGTVRVRLLCLAERNTRRFAPEALGQIKEYL
ncbi:hypothetical protein GCM10017784_30180 [Deinococcus indicus]|uniref:hypothetical protein n=1 Tax=Deinococcus indicus TaxID=223556 RepID=UPI00174A8C61|nr:hypothetical protein [Deinococcus indicus]GHG34386.1 hypothetical protein GCM10017784_30180 [Deinococcus indicus]